jgi:ribonuclease P protein component
VDKFQGDPGDGFWLGCVVPKRHARRAVTRNLVRRQIRAVMGRHLPGLSPGLPPGLWLVRLRQPFDRRQFVSAASERLRDALRAELELLFARAAFTSARAIVAAAVPIALAWYAARNSLS